MVQQDPSVLLVVIGDGALKGSLQQLAGELHMSESVRWLGSFYEEDRLAPWFLIARCFVYPGAIGLSLIHALNYGLPVITHDQMRNHMPEIAALKPGVNGLLFRRNDPSDLAAKIRLVCGDRDLREKLSLGARWAIRDHFNMNHMVGQMVQAIRAAREGALLRAALNGTTSAQPSVG
jgi:glycosyltransferase involved in cell wall biosynthesis